MPEARLQTTTKAMMRHVGCEGSRYMEDACARLVQRSMLAY